MRDVTVAFAWFFSFPVAGLAAPSLSNSIAATVVVAVVGAIWVASSLWTPVWGPATSAIPLAGVVMFLPALFAGELLLGYNPPPAPAAELVVGVVVVLAFSAAGAGAVSTMTAGRLRWGAMFVHLASGVGLLLVVATCAVAMI